MKYKIILFVALFAFPLISFSQEYKITYQLEFSQMEKMITEEVPVEKRSGHIILEAIPYLKNFEPILWIKNQEAVFETNLLMERGTDNGLGIKIAKILSKENSGPIYQNLKSDFSLKTIETMGEKFLVIYPFDEFNWEITTEKETINGIEAQKATTVIKDDANDQHIEAWFARSIPISSGPLQFGGLPGLIIKLSIGPSYIVTLKDIEESPKKEKTIEKPKGTSLSHEEYLKQFKELQKKNPFSEHLRNENDE